MSPTPPSTTFTRAAGSTPVDETGSAAVGGAEVPTPDAAPAAPPSSTTTIRDALRTAIREALDADDRVFYMGEDVGAYGGCFAVTMGLLDDFGPERVRDTPLSESGFVGAGIGAALGGMRPIVEIMTCNFALLALDQIVNNAATLLHMSGGQTPVPLVILTTAGAGRQLAAQHSHSFEPLFAHIPGLRVASIGTVEDARGMLWTALEDPDPVVLFEYPAMFQAEGELPSDAGPVDLDHAAVRRAGRDVTIVTYGQVLPQALAAAEALAAEHVDAEVIDLRTLRPLDDGTIVASVARTHRLVIAEEAWRTGGIGAEVSARVVEQAFYELDDPIMRLGSTEVPMPYAKHLEDAAVPRAEQIAGAVRRMLGLRRP